MSLRCCFFGFVFRYPKGLSLLEKGNDGMQSKLKQLEFGEYFLHGHSDAVECEC